MSKLIKILIGLFIIHNIFFDRFIEEYHNLVVLTDQAKTGIELYNFNSEDYYNRKYILSTIIITEPYSVVFHITPDDVKAQHSISVRLGENEVFDLNAEQISQLPKGVIETKFAKGGTLEYTTDSFESTEYYTLYFAKINISDQTPLIITVTTIDEQGQQKIDRATINQKIEFGTSSRFWSGLMSV